MLNPNCHNFPSWNSLTTINFTNNHFLLAETPGSRRSADSFCTRAIGTCAYIASWASDYYTQGRQISMYLYRAERGLTLHCAQLWLVTAESTPHCTCSHLFSVEHVLTFKTGGFPVITHNEVRDITASLLSEVCHGVTIEPHLQPLSGENTSYNTAITDDGARLDTYISMYGFWGGHFEKAFVDVRAFNPCARSNRRSPIIVLYTGDMNRRRRGSMSKESAKWSTLLSPHS